MKKRRFFRQIGVPGQLSHAPLVLFDSASEDPPEYIQASPAHFIIKWRCVAPAAAKFIFLNSEHNAIHAKFNCKTAPFPGLGPANIYNVAEPADTRCMIQILLLGRLRSSLEYPYI